MNGIDGKEQYTHDPMQHAHFFIAHSFIQVVAVAYRFIQCNFLTPANILNILKRGQSFLFFFLISEEIKNKDNSKENFCSFEVNMEGSDIMRKHEDEASVDREQ